MLVGISYDSVESLKRFAAKRSVTFPLLSDAGSKTIDAYGIRNKAATGKGEGIPHPGTFILNQKGVVTAKLSEETYRQRHPVPDLIKALQDVK